MNLVRIHKLQEVVVTLKVRDKGSSVFELYDERTDRVVSNPADQLVWPNSQREHVFYLCRLLNNFNEDKVFEVMERWLN
jgi:hypothetical protein